MESLRPIKPSNKNHGSEGSRVSLNRVRCKCGREQIMSIKSRSINRRKRLIASKSLGLPESVLKLFPKTSRMSKAEPSRWEIADNRKVRVSDRPPGG